MMAADVCDVDGGGGTDLQQGSIEGLPTGRGEDGCVFSHVVCQHCQRPHTDTNDGRQTSDVYFMYKWNLVRVTTVEALYRYQ